MRTSILITVLCAASALLVASARAAAVTVNGTVTAGATLSVAANGTPSFNLTLNGVDQAATYTVRFSATDDGNGTGVPLTSVIDVPITVGNANRAPELVELHNISVQKGTVTEVPILAIDPDGDPLMLAFDSLPRFATFTEVIADA